MKTESEDSEDITKVDANLKTQDEPIIDAFAQADDPVLLTKEVAEKVELSDRQVRRRLKDLASRDILRTRKPSRDRLWWLDRDVKEPITAQYPSLQLIKDRLSLQLLCLGLGVGVSALFLVSAASLAFGYNIDPPFISKSTLLRMGILTAITSSGFFLSSVVTATLGSISDILQKLR